MVFDGTGKLDADEFERRKAEALGLAEKIAPLRLGPRLEETVPAFWA